MLTFWFSMSIVFNFPDNIYFIASRNFKRFILFYVFMLLLGNIYILK